MPTFHPVPSFALRAGGNALRLTATFGIGLVQLALISRLGADALALYLLLLSLRATGLLLSDTVEAALVPYLATGNAFAARLLGVFSAAAAMVLLAAILGFGQLQFDGIPPLTMIWGSVATICLVGLQVAVAPSMATLVRNERMLAYSLLIVARRGSEFMALLCAIAIGGLAGPSVLSLYFQLLVVASLVLAFTVVQIAGPLAPIQSDQIARLGSLFVNSALIGLAAILMMRAPVLVLNALLGGGATITFGLIFVILGYLRQTASVILAGFDGVASRLGRHESETTILQATLAQSLIVTLLATGLSTQTDWVFAHLAGADSENWSRDQTVTLFRIMLVGATARAIAECWTKAISGLGGLAQVAPRVACLSVIYCGLCIGAALLLEKQAAYQSIAIGFSAIQVGIACGILPVAVARLTGGRVSLFLRNGFLLPLIAAACVALGTTHPVASIIAGAALFGLALRHLATEKTGRSSRLGAAP
jgi:hypothetical protein